jgi:6-phosphogluconolactonase
LTHYRSRQGAAYFTADPTGKFLYGITEGYLTAHSITSKGALKRVIGSPYPDPNLLTPIVVDPSGKFAYAPPLPGVGSISAYRIGPSGQLDPVPNSPFGKGGWDAAIDPTGKFLYVAENDNVAGYVIGPKGELTAIPGSPFATGNLPMSIAIISQ